LKSFKPIFELLKKYK